MTKLSLSPDGKRILTGSTDTTASLCEVGRPETKSKFAERSRLIHKGPVRGVGFSKDGLTVATGVGYNISNQSSEVHFWDAYTGHERSDTIYVTHQLRDVVFTPNGEGLAVGGGYLRGTSGYGYIRQWRVPPPAIDDPARLRLSVELRTGKRLDENGAVRRMTFDEWKSRLHELAQTEKKVPCDAPSWDEYKAWRKEREGRETK